MRRRRRLQISLEPRAVLDLEDDEELVEAMAGMFQETSDVPGDVAKRWARFSIYGRTEPRPATEETAC